MRKILVLTTGGTIASTMTPHGLIPSLSSEALLEYLPDMDMELELHTQAVCNLDSTDMTPELWIELAKTIKKNYYSYDGFVICHGTDTMAYTAAALSYLIQDSPKPVVLTGAQKPIGLEITDAKANIRDSIIYAADEKSWGVQIVFDGKVIVGTRAKKTKTQSYAAFSSINFPFLALIQNGNIVRFIQPNQNIGPVKFYDKLNTNVFLMKLTPGMSPVLLDAIFETYDSVIIESFGVGGIPASLEDKVFEILGKYKPEEKIVVMTTQVTYEGSNVGTYEVGRKLRDNFSILEARDMTLEAALAKIMWIMADEDLTWDTIKGRFYEKVSSDILM